MNRRLSTVGTVVALTYPGFEQRPEVIVTVESTAGVIDLIFQSRRTIGALDIGQTIEFSGATVEAHGSRSIYNPEYDIVKGDNG